MVLKWVRVTYMRDYLMPPRRRASDTVPDRPALTHISQLSRLSSNREKLSGRRVQCATWASRGTRRRRLDKEWDLIRPERQSSVSSTARRILRVALLFGLCRSWRLPSPHPIFDSRTRPGSQARFDGLPTTPRQACWPQCRHMLRRKAVLQDALTQAVCVIHDNGCRSGQC